MAHEDLQQPSALPAASRSLRGLLGVIIAVERRFGHEVSPLVLLQQIMSEARWSWLRPFYRMIVDIDHAAHQQTLSQEQLAVIAGFARELLSGQLAVTLADDRDVNETASSSDRLSVPDDDGVAVGEAVVESSADVAADAALFIRRYRELLQADPEVAIAHAAALQALRHLPSLDEGVVRKRQLYCEWLSRSEAQRQQ